MGSSSIGGQGVGFGLTIGTTWTDTNCQRLKNSRHLASLGFSRAAVALVCVDEDVRDAMASAGTPCPAKKQEHADAAPAVTESQERTASREDDTRVAQNAYTTVEHDALAPAPVAAPAPIAEAPAYHFVPMKPIKN